MIASGEKTEEYREIKSFWIKRLCRRKRELDPAVWNEFVEDLQNQSSFENCRHNSYNELFDFFEVVNYGFTHIVFAHGYAKNAPKLFCEITEHYIGKGKQEWGAELGKEYFVFKILLKPSI